MQAISIRGEFVTEYFDCDFAPELHVFGEVDHTHATRTELFENSVVGNLFRIHLHDSKIISWRTCQQCSSNCGLKQKQNQKRHDRRNIEPAKSRDHSPERSQQWLSYIYQEPHDSIRVTQHTPRENDTNKD